MEQLRTAKHGARGISFARRTGASYGFPVTFRLEFDRDPAAFLAVAGDHLRADPVLNTVCASIAQRDATERESGLAFRPDDWYLSVRDERDGRVCGVGMRTAPFPPRPLYLLPMPDAAATRLAQVLAERAEPVAGANGALPTTAIFAEELARLSNGTVEVGAHTRLFELRSVIDPLSVPGALRSATAADTDLVLSWFAAFHHDADVQAGRAPAEQNPTALQPEVVRRKIEAGLVWLWTSPSGEVVHLTGANAACFGAQRIGPVYTPPEHRGHGYASAAVAELSRRFLAAGSRPCLFTDQANPVSNAIYQAIGYRPVVDMINLRIG